MDGSIRAATQKRKRRTAEESHSEIVAAATRLFLEKGFKGTTTAEIAREAGVAEGTIFKYFATKKDLLLDVIRPKAAENIPNLMRGLGQMEPEEVLRRFLRLRFAIIQENAHLFRFMITEAQFQPEVREVLVETIIKPIQGMMKAVFERAQADGRFRNIPFLPSLRSFMGMVLAYDIFGDRNLFPEFAYETSIDEVVENILDLFLYGVAGNPLQKREEPPRGK